MDAYAKASTSYEEAHIIKQVQTLLRPPPLCEGCGVNRADPPSKLCPGCQAYKEHQQ